MPDSLVRESSYSLGLNKFGATVLYKRKIGILSFVVVFQQTFICHIEQGTPGLCRVIKTCKLINRLFEEREATQAVFLFFQNKSKIS